GTERAYEETFGSTCHGAGRRMSRAAAKKLARGRSVVREMEDQGIFVRADGYATIAEEIPEAYKDVADVVDVVHRGGISRKGARPRASQRGGRGEAKVGEARAASRTRTARGNAAPRRASNQRGFRREEFPLGQAGRRCGREPAWPRAARPLRKLRRPSARN